MLLCLSRCKPLLFTAKCGSCCRQSCTLNSLDHAVCCVLCAELGAELLSPLHALLLSSGLLWSTCMPAASSHTFCSCTTGEMGWSSGLGANGGVNTRTRAGLDKLT